MKRCHATIFIPGSFVSLYPGFFSFLLSGRCALPHRPVFSGYSMTEIVKTRPPRAKKVRKIRSDKDEIRLPYKKRAPIKAPYAKKPELDPPGTHNTTNIYDIMADCKTLVALDKRLTENNMVYSTIQNGEVGRIVHEPSGLSVTFSIKPRSSGMHKMYNLDKLLGKIQSYKSEKSSFF